MSLAILFHLLCAQHVSDINISILGACDCVAGWSTTCDSACKTNTTKYQPQQKLQHTTNWEQDDWCGNSSTQSQAPKMDILMSETCWAHKKWNKIASGILNSDAVWSCEEPAYSMFSVEALIDVFCKTASYCEFAATLICVAWTPWRTLTALARLQVLMGWTLDVSETSLGENSSSCRATDL